MICILLTLLAIARAKSAQNINGAGFKNIHDVEVDSYTAVSPERSSVTHFSNFSNFSY